MPPRIVVSTNMASVDGTAPAGRTVFSSRIEEGGLSQIRGVAKADANGQFAIKNLAPGKYRIVAIDNGVTDARRRWAGNHPSTRVKPR